MNQNLPGYVVMTELAMPQGGPGNWSNGFLPAQYQGTRLRPEGSPILVVAGLDVVDVTDVHLVYGYS